MDAPALHGVERPEDLLPLLLAHAPAAVVEEVEQLGVRRELGRAAVTAVHVVVARAERVAHRGEDLRIAVVGLGQLRPVGHARDLLREGARRGLDVAAVLLPGDAEPLAELPQRGGRQVRAAPERLAVGREQHGHRPAAAPAAKLHEAHVDAVHVGPLLAVDLHADEGLCS